MDAPVSFDMDKTLEKLRFAAVHVIVARNSRLLGKNGARDELGCGVLVFVPARLRN